MDVNLRHSHFRVSLARIVNLDVPVAFWSSTRLPPRALTMQFQHNPPFAFHKTQTQALNAIAQSRYSHVSRRDEPAAKRPRLNGTQESDHNNSHRRGLALPQHALPQTHEHSSSRYDPAQTNIAPHTPATFSNAAASQIEQPDDLHSGRLRTHSGQDEYTTSVADKQLEEQIYGLAHQQGQNLFDEDASSEILTGQTSNHAGRLDALDPPLRPFIRQRGAK